MAQDQVPSLPKSSSNSNVKGCVIGCAIVFIVGAIGAGVVGYGLFRGVSGFMEAMTETEPRPIPEVTMTDEEATAVSEKLEAFKTALNSGDSAEKEFSLTGQEVNVLIRSDDTAKVFGDSVYVTIEGGEMKGEMSLRLGDLLPVAFLENRYLNGAATFSVSAQDGRLYIYVEELKIKGETAPDSIMDQLRQENFAAEMMKKPDFEGTMAKIESVEVVDDRLVVRLK
tara:strand:+ start:222 stop:899 length:678 start_codon:yes stop_codon:yes gene_type:complete